MLVKAAVQVTHWTSIPRLEVNFAPKQSDQSESGCLETLICWHIRPTNQRASQSTNQRSCWIPRKAPNRSTAADGDTEEEEKKNELVDPHVALRATCARELERYGANPKVALDWSVCILADIPDLFDSWFTTVSPALAKLAPRSCEQMDKLSPLERARNKPWMVVAHKAKSWSNALHSLAGMSSLPTDLVGHSSC
jgi:hypothetical protein